MDMNNSDSDRDFDEFIDGDVALSMPMQFHNGQQFNDTETVSSTFHPDAQLNTLAPDVVLTSSDAVVFYVHSHLLLGASDNGFCSLLRILACQNHSVLRINESSVLLTIILYAIYTPPGAQFSPAFPTLVAAVNRLHLYGLSPKLCITPSSLLFALLLSHAFQCPLNLYALAASHDIHDLAAFASLHLLSFNLASLTDDMADLMGPIYLKRLFFLHVGRLSALKRVLLSPPNPHSPTHDCSFNEQKSLTRAWALASAYLAWDARPDLSTGAMESALRPLAQRLSCDGCRCALRARIDVLVAHWAAVKETI